MYYLQVKRLLSFVIAAVMLAASLSSPSAHAFYPAPAPETIIHVEDPELCDSNPASAQIKDLVAKKSTGRPLSFDAYVGRQLVIEASLAAECYRTADEDGNYPFVLVIEIRDSDGITRHLAIQQGTIEPWTEMPVGFSWVPYEPGEYEIRAFSMNDLNSKTLLARIVTITVTVV